MTEIETGVQSQHEDAFEAIPGDEDPDVAAFADDGEHATVWGISRHDDTRIVVDYVRCEAGLCEFDAPSEVYHVDADKETVEFAEELVGADPEEAVDLARAHWSDGE